MQLTGNQQRHDGARGRRRQPQKRGTKIAIMRHRRRDQQRSGERSRLIERGVNPEAPPMPDLSRRFRQQNIARRAAQRFSAALGYYQPRGRGPASRQRHGRHHDQVHGVAGDRESPVGARPVRQFPGKQPQTGRQHFAHAGYESNLQRRAVQMFQERADDAVRTFIGHVREKTDDPQTDNEFNGGGALGFRDGQECPSKVSKTARIPSRSRMLTPP